MNSPPPGQNLKERKLAAYVLTYLHVKSVFEGLYSHLKTQQIVEWVMEQGLLTKSQAKALVKPLKKAICNEDEYGAPGYVYVYYKYHDEPQRWAGIGSWEWAREMYGDRQCDGKILPVWLNGYEVTHRSRDGK